MVAPIVAAGGAKAAERAGKALTGDIYTRRWTTKGKRKTTVEHELRVNPVGIGLGAVAVGATALAAGVSLWILQLRAAPITTTADWYKWVWPDGKDASTLYTLAAPIARPQRTVGYTEVWRLYTGSFTTPYIVVPAGTDGAVLTKIPIIEYAVQTFVENKTTTRFGIQERRGFTILGGDGAVLPSTSDAAKFLLLPAGPITWLKNKLG